MNTTPDPAQASSASAALGQDISTVLKGLVESSRDAVELEIRKAREQTCLRPEEKDPQTNTAWIGLAEAPVASRTAANRALDRMDQHLLADSWEKKNEVTDESTRALYFRKGDLGATAKIVEGASRPTLEVIVTSPCAEQPVEHRMQRLEIDADYGKNSKYYDDGK